MGKNPTPRATSDAMFDDSMLQRLRDAEAAGLPASTVNGCTCDFCTGLKKHDDNWCTYCGNVQMTAPKWWENMDACDACDAVIAARAKEGTA